MIYDMAQAQRGTCAVCRMNAALWFLCREHDDPPEGDDGEMIEACMRCIVDAMLDGIAAQPKPVEASK